MNLGIAMVLYSPSWNSLQLRLESIAPREVTLFDNSPSVAPPEVLDWMSQQAHLTYLHAGANRGICTPYQDYLNSHPKLEWMMTLDQDSLADGEFVESMIQSTQRFLQEHPEQRVGVFSPYHLVSQQQEIPSQAAEPILAAMSSGSILSTQALQAVGGFDQEFWLDGFDHDYCLGMSHQGYAILRLNTAVLKHSLGELIQVRSWLTFNKREITQHPSWRRRLITRNRRLLWAKHPYAQRWIRIERYQELKDFAKILLYESNKISKLNSLLLGWVEYYRGHRGAPHYIHGAVDE